MTNQPKKTTTKRKPASNSKTPPVYFLSLEVKDVLCFKDSQQLNLSDKNGKPAQWTVILGNNGVGKTTLLRCLAGVEKIEPKAYPLPFLMQHSHFQFGSKLIWEESKTLHASSAKIIAMTISNIPLSGFKGSPEVTKEYLKSLKAMMDFSLGNPSTCSIYFEDLGENLTELQRMQLSHELLVAIECYGYGATRRNSNTSLGEKVISENSASLFSDNATLINAEEWLLQTDYAVKSSTGKTRTRLKKEFNHIIEILKRILPDVENIRISLDEDEDLPRAEFLTPYGWVRLASLGLGYRTTIAWMVDLAVRLFQRYPDSEDPLAEPAIVLVDEIDLHMHPTWQRSIMEFLTERFPNTQFIVTAHSPLVVQAAQDANIVLLRREGDRVVIDNNPEIIDNWRVDQVLTSVFELPSARPANLDHLLARRQKILSKSKLSKADQVELKQLEEQIGSLPTAETSEDIKAMDIIRRAAKLLEKSGSEAVE